jgi:hypothetical protein
LFYFSKLIILVANGKQCRAKTEKYISINVAPTFQTRYDRAYGFSIMKIIEGGGGRGDYWRNNIHYHENYCAVPIMIIIAKIIAMS